MSSEQNLFRGDRKDIPSHVEIYANVHRNRFTVVFTGKINAEGKLRVLLIENHLQDDPPEFGSEHYDVYRLDELQMETDKVAFEEISEAVQDEILLHYCDLWGCKYPLSTTPS